MECVFLVLLRNKYKNATVYFYVLFALLPTLKTPITTTSPPSTPKYPSNYSLKEGMLVLLNTNHILVHCFVL